MLGQQYTWKTGDTGPTNVTTLLDRDGNPADLTGATVKFLMRRGAAVKINAFAEIVDPAAGTVRYHRTGGDTDTVGVYQAEYEVVFSSGDRQTFPEGGYLTVVINDDIG